jgi:hypothetical protein
MPTTPKVLVYIAAASVPCSGPSGRAASDPSRNPRSFLNEGRTKLQKISKHPTSMRRESAGLFLPKTWLLEVILSVFVVNFP